VSRLAVVGDVLLDRDVLGTVDRICPDAPAPVLDVAMDVARPGGAGLAALLLAGQGHDVTLIAAVGDDGAGREVAELLAQHGVRLAAMATAGTTREKVRLRAAGQTLLRVDRGTRCPPRDAGTGEHVAAVTEAEAVLVSDYAGGMLADEGVRALLTATAARKPVVWDPHSRGSDPVPGCRLVTPNSGEAAALGGGAVPGSAAGGGPLAAARRQAEALLHRWQAHAVSVTLGPDGALLTYGDGVPLVVPAERVDGGDTCGAGDRFAAAALAALAGGAVVSDAVEQAVRAATTFVAAGGAAAVPVPSRAAPPVPDDVVQRVRAAGGTVVATGGCFDLLHAGHIALLRAARALGDCLVVCLNSDASVRRLKGEGRPLVTAPDRARVLAALECVDAVEVFGEDLPDQVLRRVRPDVWAKGGDYAIADLPEAAVLHEWGGQAVLLPYLDGRSTTALIDLARDDVPRGRVPTMEESS
jgi:rfaE bifunctional protein nucleotidyltransferase chain/domain/rfaE bifunctional protein kinase chain/domain